MEGLCEAFGINVRESSPGRVTTGNPAAPFIPVSRFGVPPGPDDLTIPQIWIEPHEWRIHRIIAEEGNSLLRVDYIDHGLVANLPWMPKEIHVYKGEQIVSKATILGVRTEIPSDETFSMEALAAQAAE